MIKDVVKNERTNKEIVENGHTEGKRTEGEHEDGEHTEAEHVEGEHTEGEQIEDEHVEGEYGHGEHVEGEHAEGENAEGEHAEGEHTEGKHTEGEHAEGEHAQAEHTEDEHIEGEQVEGEDKEKIDGEDIPDLENIVAEQTDEPQPVDEPPVEEEEDQYVEEPPPDPTAPYNFSDSQEALQPKYELRLDQVAEVEQLWDVFQNYTPAYSDIDNYITEKELVYMLKCLILLPVTPEQLQELIAFCVRPPHPEGHISYEQFLRIVTMRQRDVNVEEELRAALKVFDRGNTGEISREEIREVLLKQGHKLPAKMVDNLIKEVDMSNDGTLGVEDIVGTMCIDLNPEDLEILRNTVYPPEQRAEHEEF